MRENDTVFHLGNAHLQTYALFAAHQLHLFEIIAEKSPITIKEVCQALNMDERPVQGLLSICASNGLLSVDEKGHYTVSDVTRTCLLKSSPFPWGRMLDVHLMNPASISYQSFISALAKNASQIYDDEDLFESNEASKERAVAFTRAMHGKSKASAHHWPVIAPLTDNQCLLDVAGGSGIHAICAVNAFSQLRGLVLDRPEVCNVAREYIVEAGLLGRVDAAVCDMWKDDFPPSDVHFYSDVFHDWAIEDCRKLAKKSFHSLPKGGKILVHELLFNEQKTGPLSTALYNMVMLMWTKGQQFSERELTELLHDTGFMSVKITRTGYGDWSLISGIKP